MESESGAKLKGNVGYSQMHTTTGSSGERLCQGAKREMDRFLLSWQMKILEAVLDGTGGHISPTEIVKPTGYAVKTHRPLNSSV